MTTVSHKRIAKNTLFLYIRMAILLVITLFTSRIVLEKLGVTDYGVYNIVAGVATMCAMFNTSLSNATERFLNISLGKQDINEANRIFNQNLLVFTLIALGIVLISETLVKWLIFDHLVIPKGKEYAAWFVYQCSIFSIFVTLMGIVFISEIIAHEDMKIFSIVGVADGVMKLGIAFLINAFPIENLISYALMMAIETTVCQSLYIVYCLKEYEECRFRFIWNKGLIKQTFKFIGWNSAGSIIYMTKDAGVNILINLFFGPVANAARAVAVNLSGAVSQFTNNIFVAIRPQLIKAYATDERTELIRLFLYSSKYTLLLFWFICLPFMLCVNQILHIWLVDIPENSGIFIVWVLADLLLAVLTNPTWSISLASGNIARMTILGNGILLLILPICWLAFKMGAPAVSAFIIIFIVRIFQIISVLIIANRDIHFSLKVYLKKVLFPSGIAILLSGIVMIIIKRALVHFENYDFLFIFLIGIISTVITGGLIFFVGLSKKERETLISKLNFLYKRRFKQSIS